jgi:hypothetical protein
VLRFPKAFGLPRHFLLELSRQPEKPVKKSQRIHYIPPALPSLMELADQADLCELELLQALRLVPLQVRKDHHGEGVSLSLELRPAGLVVLEGANAWNCGRGRSSIAVVMKVSAQPARRDGIELPVEARVRAVVGFVEGMADFVLKGLWI